MTMTAIGILLIVQCVTLWGILAALYRHTSELKALRERLDALRRLPGVGAANDASASPEEGRADDQVDRPDRGFPRGNRRSLPH